MTKQDKRGKGKLLHKAEIFAIIMLLAFFSLALLKPKVTGYIEATNTTTYKQELNLMIDKDSSYIFSSPDSKPLPLTLVKISGEVIGEGRVEILINDGKKQSLIYANVAEKKNLGHLTGMAVENDNSKLDSNEEKAYLVVEPSDEPVGEYQFRALQENEEILPGAFNYVCIETCQIPKGYFNSAQYYLFFKVEDGTKLRIDDIVFNKG